MTFKEIINQLEKGDLRRIDGSFSVGNDTFIYRAWKMWNNKTREFGYQIDV